MFIQVYLYTLIYIKCTIKQIALFCYRKRIPTDQVIYYRCPRHRLRFVITILLAFEIEEDVYQIALSYPYTYSRLEERLTFLNVLTSRFQESDHYLGGKKNQVKPSNVFGISSSNLLFTREQIGSSLVSFHLCRYKIKLAQLQLYIILLMISHSFRKKRILWNFGHVKIPRDSILLH